MKTCGSCVWWLPNRPEFRLLSNPFCINPKINWMTLRELGCDNHVSKDSVEVNVPQHLKKGNTWMESNNVIPVDGPVEILIVTHAKDLPWLEYCLRSIHKFCTGFQGVTVTHPAHEADKFMPLHGRFSFRLRLHAYDEVKGKGMLQHMVKMAEADLIVQPGTKYVLTCDADCIFKMPTTPADYFADSKPYYIVRTWDSLTTEDPANPGSKVVSDCLQWKAPTDRQVGFDTKWFGMCMNTVVFPIHFFAKYRAHIESVHGRSFEEFMLDGRNEFPQSNMDFTAMGAYAEKFMHEDFTWFDVEQPPYPADRKTAFWSHGGVTAQVAAEIESILSK